MGSPGSRAWRFRTCPGSLTTRGPPTARENATSSVAFHLCDSVGTPNPKFRGSIARPARAPPGARAYYDQLRARGVGHHAALRQLANRLVGVLHGCLKTRTTYDETTAWAHHQQELQAAA